VPAMCQFIPVRKLQMRRDSQIGYTLEERKKHQRRRRLLIQIERKEKVMCTIFI